MRYALLLAALALACAADPVLLPDASPPADAGPCGGACGAGTVCEGGACVAVDAGAVDAGGGVDAVDVVAVDAGTPDAESDGGAVDAGVDVGPADALPAGCASTTAGNCCGVACPAPAHGVAFCGGGRCGVESCEAGWGNCDGNAANGCETDTTTSAAHCGGCGAPCAATLSCVAGACVLVCGDRFRNCDGVTSNGCETDVRNNRAHCGACGNACLGAQVCRASVCSN